MPEHASRTRPDDAPTGSSVLWQAPNVEFVAEAGPTSVQPHTTVSESPGQLELDLGLPVVPPNSRLAHRSLQLMLWEFHEAFELPRNAHPVIPVLDVPPWLTQLRLRLQREETEELAEALGAGDVVGVADALADIVYVAYGTAVTFGIDLDHVLAEVHRSNMSKLDAAGRPILRSDGKVLKGEAYSPPDIPRVLRSQRLARRLPTRRGAPSCRS